MPPKYKRTCPYCGETCEAYYPNNLICKCGAKYYCKTDTWLEREKKQDHPDLVAVVRCKDCSHGQRNGSGQLIGHYICEYDQDGCLKHPSHYCSYGKRREG